MFHFLNLIFYAKRKDGAGTGGSARPGDEKARQ